MNDLSLSCADFTFPLLDHAQALRLIEMIGFSGVDVGLFSERSHLQPEHIAIDPVGRGMLLRRDLSDRGLALADVFVQLGADPALHAVSEPDAPTREIDRGRFLRCVEFAHAAGAQHITGLPGVTTGGGISLAIDETSWRLDAAAKAGLHYAIEPHVGSNCPTVPSVIAFLRRVPGLTLTLDYGHFVYQGASPDSVDVLLPHASHFHARGGASGRLQASLSKNVIDFAPMVVEALGRATRRYICVEYVWVDWEGCNEVDNVSESILMSRHLRNQASIATHKSAIAKPSNVVG